MREITIIAGRELRSYFVSPIAYVFGALFLAVQIGLTVFFTNLLRDGGPAHMQDFFGRYLPWVLLFAVPIFTMRLWAEERKLGTLELLMTFPVKAWQLIAGKFMASLIYLSLLLALTLGLPLTVASHGDLDWGPVFGAYVASLFLASSYVAVGMFCSSVTRDQIIAALVAIVLLLLLFLPGLQEVQIPLSGALPHWLVEILGGISPYGYFQSISRGVFDTRDFVFYVCFCGFFLYLNAMVLQGRRMKG